MVTISYNLILKNENDFKDPEEIFKESLEGITTTNLDMGLFENCIIEKYRNEISNELTFINFQISLDDEISHNNVSEILEIFNTELKNINNEAIFKFYDDYLLIRLKNLQNKIFEVEMKIREMITFIFVSHYGSEFYDLFTEMKIAYQFPDERTIKENTFKRNMLKNKIDMREKYLRTMCENELFYFSFNDYKNISQVDELKEVDLIDIASRSSTFDEFKHNIINRGIESPIFSEFLNNVSGPLTNLVPIRNCIAHNRNLSEEEIEKFESIYYKLEEIIETFVKKLKDEEILVPF